MTGYFLTISKPQGRFLDRAFAALASAGKIAAAAALAFLFGSIIVAEFAAAESCSGIPTDVDACFATPGCAWIQTTSRCVQRRDAVRLRSAWVYEPGKPNQLSKVDGHKLRPVTKPAFDNFGLNRQCPSEVLDYLRKYELLPTRTLPNKLQPVSNWLVWPNDSFGRDDKLKQKVELVQAYQALRREGQCARNMAGDAAANLKLRMSLHAIHNWKQAKPGNVFFGVIDCQSWQIYLLPQRRLVDDTTQTAWNPEQLPTIRWTATGLTLRDKLLPAEAFDIISRADANNSHGVSAGLVAGWDKRNDGTLGAACEFDRQVRANYLGFTVWKRKVAPLPGQKIGEPVWVFSSRQLNGANNFDVMPKADGSSVTEKYRTADGTLSVRNVYKPDGTIKDPAAHDKKTVGLLPAELQQKIRHLGGVLKP